MNDDEKAKTGDDSLTSTSATASYENDESTNTEIDKGLVVIKSSRPSYNQITYSASQKDYVVGSDSDVTNGTKVYLTSLDNPVTFKCLTNDAHSTVEWTAAQTYESVATTSTSKKTYTDTADSSKTSTITTTTVTGESLNQLNTPVDLTSSLVATADSKNQIQAIDLPYGTTVVTSKVTADDPQYNTTYTITLTKRRLVGTTEKTSELKSLSVTPNEGSTIPIWNKEFSPDDRSYEVTVDEDCDELTFDFGTGAGVEVAYPLVGITKSGEYELNYNYTVALMSGTSKYIIPVKDSDGSVKTYTVTVVKPDDGDTSLKYMNWASKNTNNISKANYLKGSSYDNGVTSFTLDTTAQGGSSSSAAKSYAMTVSADNRIDVSDMAFTAVPTHKYTTLYYCFADDCPIVTSDDWATGYSRATEKALYDSAESESSLTDFSKYQISKALNESSASDTTTLWIKAVTKEYKHNLSNDTIPHSDVSYHKVVITKAGTGNTKLTDLKIVTTTESGTTSKVGNYYDNNSTVAYSVGTVANINVSTFVDKATLYFRTLDKDATVSYTATNTSYADDDSENKSFTNYANSKKTVTTTSTTLTPYTNSLGLTYYQLDLGKVEEGSDLPNGTTTVAIYVNGTTCDDYTFNFVKPNLADVTYSGLSFYGDGSSGSVTRNEQYIYVQNSVKTITLSLNTTQQNAKINISSCTHTAGANNSTSFTQAAPSWASYQYTYSETTDPEDAVKWQIKIGEESETAPTNYTSKCSNTSLTPTLPVGTTTLNLLVTNDKNTSGQIYTYYIIRTDNSEARLESLTYGETSGKDFDWSSSTTPSTYVISNSFAFDNVARTLYAKPVSEEATISATVIYSSSKTATTVSDFTGTSTSLTDADDSDEYFSCQYTPSDGGCYMFTVTVTAGNKTDTHTYYLIAKVLLDTDNTLRSLNAVQCGKTDSTDYYYTLLGTTFSSSTYAYTKEASLDYVGNIVVTPTKNSSYSTVALTSVKYDGSDMTLNTDYKVNENVVTIPYIVYSKYTAGKTIAVLYTVTSQDSTTQTYEMNVTIPGLTEVSTKNVADSGDLSTYQMANTTTYKKVMAYAFGSVIKDQISSLKDYFGGLDIIGGEASSGTVNTWYASAFGMSGWQYCINVGGTDYWVKLNSTGNSSKFYTISGGNVTEVTGSNIPNVSLKITPTIEYDGKTEDATPYLVLKHELTNNSGSTVKLGSVIDTLVGTTSQSTDANNDAVTVSSTNNGFSMAANNYIFKVYLKNANGVDDVSRWWRGEYSNTDLTQMSIFSNSGEDSIGSDSAASYSWDLGSGTSYTKTIRISMESN